jgi:hypothetical protein
LTRMPFIASFKTGLNDFAIVSVDLVRKFTN